MYHTGMKCYPADTRLYLQLNRALSVDVIVKRLLHIGPVRGYRFRRVNRTANKGHVVEFDYGNNHGHEVSTTSFTCHIMHIMASLQRHFPACSVQSVV